MIQVIVMRRTTAKILIEQSAASRPCHLVNNENTINQQFQTEH